MQVVIIGAGIIGAALAHALGRAGAKVTVVEAGQVAAGASGHSFGWVNACFYADAAHFDLRAEGIAAYRRLSEQMEVPMRWSGCLNWEEEEGAALEAQAEALEALGYSVEIVSGEDIAWMEPALKVPERALYLRQEAAVEAALFTARLLARSGARVICGAQAQALETRAGRVCGVRLAGGVLAADRVIVAAGVGSAGVLQPLGVTLPMAQRPGVIFHTKRLARVLNHVCVAPIGEFRQQADGRIVMPTAIAHQADETEQLDAPLDALADAACARLQNWLPGVAIDWQQVALAERPVPQDGLPVIGACGPEGVFTAVMHSGVTLAPVVAEILAAEVMGTQTPAQAALVAPYGIARFQSG